MERLKQGNTILINIDFSTLKLDKKNAKKLIRNLKNIRKKADLFKNSVKVQIFHQNEKSLHEIQNPYEYEINVAILAIQIENKKARLEFLYDKICFYLDYICHINNLCNFKNDQCFAKQNTDVTMGCCHHFPNKKWGLLYQKRLVPCEFLSKKGCTTQSIGCKMFVCDEVKKKGYKFTVNNVLLIKYFFNFLQKFVIKTSTFESKECIMEKLLKYDF